jgi:hypothetical protein
MDTKNFGKSNAGFFVRGRNNSKSHITQCQIEAANNRPDNPMRAAAAPS